MSEVDSDHSACLHAHHEIVQMSVSNAQNPVANAHQRMRAGEVGAECQKGLRARAHLQEGAPGTGRHSLWARLPGQRADPHRSILTLYLL